MKRRDWHTFLLLTLLLGCHNGYLALFEGSDPAPVRTFPYRVEGFPQNDQEALRQGIPISSDEELTRLLQDFLS